MKRRNVIIAWFLILSCVPVRADDRKRTTLDYAPAPADNPLKGLVPYSDAPHKAFPHSLEFSYLPLSSLVVGQGQYDWKAIEQLLEAIAGRGHQAVLRIYIEYPDKSDGIPAFLVRGGLKVHRYRAKSGDTNTSHVTPNYEDSKLRSVIKEFITAFGKKYDGDPRIGFLTAGLLGYWGEWHTYPRENLFASKAVQTEVLDAYESSFKITPVLLRYPQGPDDDSKASNTHRKFGYHDDSFAWSTLETGKKDDDWFYMTALKAAGPEAVIKWKSCPIGGEIRPEAWGKVFDERPNVKEIQDFRTCVDQTHVSWLMDSGMFESAQNAARTKRAEAEVRHMGYEFHISSVSIASPKDGKIPISIEVENRGVAPFYYDWPLEYGLIRNQQITKSFRGAGKITGLLPDTSPVLWDERLDIQGIDAGSYLLAVRIPNPMPGGHPLRFANTSQDANMPGWMTLGEIKLP